uniref:Uncharacterized protein n=1 Tax=Rhizophora mucronata TaxID=61149 RepID=A0A2P2QE41_RHIMU
MSKVVNIMRSSSLNAKGCCVYKQFKITINQYIMQIYVLISQYPAKNE